jgi:hypothetical protein
MPYPEEAEGFQIDSPETSTEFHKRRVRLIQSSFTFTFFFWGAQERLARETKEVNR